MKEQRKQTRIETKALVDYTGTNALLDHKIRDISVGGLRIETEFVEEKGTVVDLFVNLPEIDESFEARGEVVWVNANKDPKDMGIKFTELSDDARQVLLKYLEFLNK